MTNKSTLLFILVFFFSFPFCKAQFNEIIRTGRPGQSIGPFAVGKNVFQIQSGVDFGGSKLSATDTSSANIISNTVFRVGISKRFEINAALNFRKDTYNNNNIQIQENGLSLAKIGTRINLRAGKKGPDVGIQLTFKLPITSSPYNLENNIPSLIIIGNQSISDKWNIAVNTGIDFVGSSTPAGLFITNLSYSISPKLSTFLENYSNFSKNSFQNRWDTGLAFMCNDNLQLDVSGGGGINQNLSDYFVSLGVSWRTFRARNLK